MAVAKRSQGVSPRGWRREGRESMGGKYSGGLNRHLLARVYVCARTNTLLKSRRSSIRFPSALLRPNSHASRGYGTSRIKGRNAFCECRPLCRCNMRVIQIYCVAGVRQTRPRRADPRSILSFRLSIEPAQSFHFNEYVVIGFINKINIGNRN